jgi:hypothetical protein
MSMKKICLLLLISTSCINEQNFYFEDELQSIVGKWKKISIQNDKSNPNKWINVQSNNTFDIIISPEGVLLDKDGFVPCCSYPFIKINEKLFTVKSNNYRLSPICAYVDVGCEGTNTLNTTIYHPDTLIIQLRFSTKYVRVK